MGLSETILQASYSLLGLKLQEVREILSDYQIKEVLCDANFVLDRNKLGEDYRHPRVIKIIIDGENAIIYYSLFKDIEDKL